MIEYAAIVKRDGDWWIGWIEEVPGVNCQEPSCEALLATLRITLHEALGTNRAYPKRTTKLMVAPRRNKP